MSSNDEIFDNEILKMAVDLTGALYDHQYLTNQLKEINKDNPNKKGIFQLKALYIADHYKTIELSKRIIQDRKTEKTSHEVSYDYNSEPDYYI